MVGGQRVLEVRVGEVHVRAAGAVRVRDRVGAPQPSRARAGVLEQEARRRGAGTRSRPAAVRLYAPPHGRSRARARRCRARSARPASRSCRPGRSRKNSDLLRSSASVLLGRAVLGQPRAWRRGTAVDVARRLGVDVADAEQVHAVRPHDQARRGRLRRVGRDALPPVDQRGCLVERVRDVEALRRRRRDGLQRQPRHDAELPTAGAAGAPTTDPRRRRPTSPLASTTSALVT